MFCQAPVESQVCGCSPLHWVVVGLHAVQVPTLHTLAQAEPMFTQVPVESHFCGCRALHRSEPGEHEPEQVAALQT